MQEIFLNFRVSSVVYTYITYANAYSNGQDFCTRPWLFLLLVPGTWYLYRSSYSTTVESYTVVYLVLRSWPPFKKKKEVMVFADGQTQRENTFPPLLHVAHYFPIVLHDKERFVVTDRYNTVLFLFYSSKII